CQYTYIMPFTF
nr:immunoglobulin light chain junction region [Macaca mulatta]